MTFHGDSLHEISNPVFPGKTRKMLSVLSTEFTQRVEKVDEQYSFDTKRKSVIQEHGYFSKNTVFQKLFLLNY